MVTIDKLHTPTVLPWPKAVAMAKALNDDPDDDWVYLAVPVTGPMTPTGAPKDTDMAYVAAYAFDDWTVMKVGHI